jgi:hypothetical protein
MLDFTINVYVCDKKNPVKAPAQPGMFYFVHTGEIQGGSGMADRSLETVLLPGVVPNPGDSDPVVSRTLTVTTAGEADIVQTLSPTDTEYANPAGYPQNVDVTFSLQDTNDDGQSGPPLVRTVQFSDESVPNQPEDINFRHDGEIQNP